MDVSESVIDPALLEASENDRRGPTTDGAIPSSFTSTSLNPPRPPSALRTRTFTKEDIQSWAASNYAPRRDANESRAEYERRLTLVTRKTPLAEACNKLSVNAPKSATLERLRSELAKYWFTQARSRPNATSQSNAPSLPSRQHPGDVLNFYPPAEPLQFAPPPGILPTVSSTARGEFRGAVPLFHLAPSTTRSTRDPTGDTSSALRTEARTQRRRRSSRPSRPSTSVPNVPTAGPSRSGTPPSSSPSPVRRPSRVRAPRGTSSSEDEEEEEEVDSDADDLIKQYGVEGANAEEILGYDDEDDEDGSDDDDEGASTSDEEAAHAAFKQTTRVQAVRRAEGNRRIGGIRTQKAVVKDFNEWQSMARKQGDIKDTIIDEHAILLYIQYSAEREKKTRRGAPIPGSRLGASQLKKLFFGVLRIRKTQDAADPGLAQRRPAATFIVWEALKNRMDEALQRVRNGLDESEDAPDIRANTFLAEVTDEQLQKIGYGFLSHRQLRLAIFGHLAWSAQHASGNRGDDFRALKLAELQPYIMMHPDLRTSILAVLGLQGEEKAGPRGMRTVINPSYSAFVANKNPEVCPLGAFAFYHHYIHDVMDVTSKLKINWSVNKSWRQIRVLHGPKSPNTPYNEQNLYNLYCKAFVSAGFTSRMKAHLPRHILGYKQEKMGVDKTDTAKLGWTRGATYFDTYAPALPKKAILGAAGFKVDETYDPVWTRVHVPPKFLELICPKAESIRDEIADRANLSGAFNYWQMVIDLRPYAFQSGAAIFQKCPKSALFRLPAFCDTDVRNWMKSTFPSELALLQAKEGNPVDLLLVQNAVLRKALEDLYRIANIGDAKLTKLTQLLERRTAVLSPAQGFSTASYHQNTLAFSSSPSTPPRSTPSAPIFVHFDEQREETGTYESSDANGTPSIRAFANESPKSPAEPRTPTQVDLVLPPLEAFYKPGGPRGIVPPLFGQKSARWPDVFAFIMQPKFCWAVWGPKTVDRYFDVQEIWSSWIDGEAVRDAAGIQTGKKPPIKLVEQYLQNKWRTPEDKKDRGTVAQHWGRYREIPEWIERESGRRTVSPSVVVAELEAMRVVGDQTKGMNWLRQEIATLRKQAAEKQAAGAGQEIQSVAATSASSTPSLPASELIQCPSALERAFEEDAPGEAEAELAQLNADGRIDGIITEDSDAFVFGARLVIRTLGPSVEHNSIVYSADCIENTDGVCLDRAGLLLCVLLLGGDYDAGVPGVGPTTAHVLALLGFGRDLVNILDSFTGAQLDRQLIGWRNTVREELCTNSRGRLGQRQPKLAEKILDTFPSLEVANLYMNPLTSASPQYIGPMPSFNSWTPREPNIFDLSGLCSSLFGWNGEHLLKKFNSNLWPGVVFRMFSSRFVLHNARMKLIASPVTRAVVLKVMKASGNNRASMDLAELNLHRVRVSTEKFISLAQLNDSPAIPDREIKLVTIPQVILSVAMRDTSLEETDLTEMPSDVEVDSDSSSGSEAEMLENSHGDSEREVNDDYGKEADEVMEIVDSDEEALLDAHGKLSAKGGVIDLTEDI
ncbi:hypothetical protein C8F04DRAFT_1404365 [Mycena alexandri]|uniref:XPG-I domain-containing protein n=1 Tax=Mycena alexandri TaxID=1745969 RepID=A0AAD6S1I2_9AGAR|nr:hypothetical protein C8F04DRAFT_1404365 [Mycena alexandri]